MADPAADLALASEFPAATRDQWMALVTAALKGAPFEKRLLGHTYDGLRIEPLYERSRRAVAMAGRAPGSPWQVLQRVDHPDPAAANAEALHDLENGAGGLSIAFAGAAGAHGYGLAPSEGALERALDQVLLDAIPVEIDLSPFAKDAVAAIPNLVKGRGLTPASTQIRFGFDPLGAHALYGWTPVAWRELAPEFSALITTLAGDGFSGPLAVADGRIVHNAGGSEAQEIAFALAVAVDYLRALEAGGIALADARRMVFFRLAADADQFLTMAKFRALRALWSQVETACGVVPEPAFVSAVTSWRMMTQRDPWVNMLRTTVATFSAGLAGADALTVLPFTVALGLPDRFARRIARNTQLILLEESHLAKVADPAAGSGAIDTLTRQLSETAWAIFQKIEAAGGAARAIEHGSFQNDVAAVRAEREAAVARRKDALTGTSEFPNILEEPVRVVEARPIALPTMRGGMTVTALPPFRLSEPFEALRDAADRVLAATGARPKIFLANLGPLAAFTARAMFAKNFFEAGGIEAVTNDGFSGEANGATNLSALAVAYEASGAALAVLCSTDDIYAREAVAAAGALSGAGAKQIYLAGRPGDLEAALKAAGVTGFIYAGCDVLKTLAAAHDRLGLSRT